MTTEEIIIHIFCFVDMTLLGLTKEPKAKLYPSEVVTIGVLFALKGGHLRAFIGGSSEITTACLVACQTARMSCNIGYALEKAGQIIYQDTARLAEWGINQVREVLDNMRN